MIDQELISDIREDMREIKSDVKGIYRILNGNGSDGLNVRVDRNTNFRKNASRALWVLFGAVVGMTAIIIRMFLFNGG
ncbi:hypothetical protein K9N50_08045 [bacterium]|nr:hypothetical protein [bacterium]